MDAIAAKMQELTAMQECYLSLKEQVVATLAELAEAVEAIEDDDREAADWWRNGGEPPE